MLNAIFALAARHLSHTSGYDHFAANRYHDMCLSSLIPLLQDGVGFSDENLFAATIILRVLEEMEGLDALALGQALKPDGPNKEPKLTLFALAQ